MVTLEDITTETPTDVAGDNRDDLTAVLYYKDPKLIIYGLFDEGLNKIGFDGPTSGYILANSKKQKSSTFFNEAVASWKQVKGLRKIIYRETDPEAYDFDDVYSLPLSFKTQSLPMAILPIKVLDELESVFDLHDELDEDEVKALEEPGFIGPIRSLARLLSDPGHIAQRDHIKYVEEKTANVVREAFAKIDSPSVIDHKNVVKDANILCHTESLISTRAKRIYDNLKLLPYALLPYSVWEKGIDAFLSSKSGDSKDDALYDIGELRSTIDSTHVYTHLLASLLLNKLFPDVQVAQNYMRVVIADNIINGLNSGWSNKKYKNNAGLIPTVLDKLYFERHDVPFLNSAIATLLEKKIKIK